METEFGDRVTFVTRYFPLSGHRNGLSSALAVEAAGRQGKFNEMHDLLYAKQKEWSEKQVATPQVFEAYAAELGLDMEKFKADVASEDVMARVMRDKNAGTALGIPGTPSFFLDGKKIENPQSVEEFRAALEAAIAANSAS
jgi:protein-disulfide isomerase